MQRQLAVVLVLLAACAEEDSFSAATDESNLVADAGQVPRNGFPPGYPGNAEPAGPPAPNTCLVQTQTTWTYGSAWRPGSYVTMNSIVSNSCTDGHYCPSEDYPLFACGLPAGAGQCFYTFSFRNCMRREVAPMPHTPVDGGFVGI